MKCFFQEDGKPEWQEGEIQTTDSDTKVTFARWPDLDTPIRKRWSVSLSHCEVIFSSTMMIVTGYQKTHATAIGDAADRFVRRSFNVRFTKPREPKPKRKSSKKRN